MKLFRNLTVEEWATFKQWARDNYKPYQPISGVWHPIVQAECAQINAETQLNLTNKEQHETNG